MLTKLTITVWLLAAFLAGACFNDTPKPITQQTQVVKYIKIPVPVYQQVKSPRFIEARDQLAAAIPLSLLQPKRKYK